MSLPLCGQKSKIPRRVACTASNTRSRTCGFLRFMSFSGSLPGGLNLTRRDERKLVKLIPRQTVAGPGAHHCYTLTGALKDADERKVLIRCVHDR